MVKVIISVPNLTGSDLQNTVIELQKLGLNDSAVLDKIGIVTGTIMENKMAELQKVKGVSSVRKEKETHLA